MRIFWIDLKLAVRMFVKYPGLSLVAVIAMALAIAIGAGYFAAFGAFLDSTQPIEQGERAIVIRNRTVSGPDAGDVDLASADDFVRWRGELKSVQDVSAFVDERRNLISDTGRAQEVRVAAMTASGFRFNRVAPLMGRTLIDEDEHPGAPAVVVIAYEEWQREFAGDPRILERTIRLDGTVHAIVGVMPEGFAFPIRHRYWVPLRLTGADRQPGAGPGLYVFGRVADGFSLSDARAELATAGDQMAAAFPQTHANVRPQAMPYTQALMGLEGPEVEFAIRSIHFGVGLFLVIVAVNVSILVYARTATRMGEIAVRTALGASRGRVVSQLFAEALVLSLTAAAIGLTMVRVVLGVMADRFSRSMDSTAAGAYWIDFTLSTATIMYVAALAVIAAAIVGVVPGLKAKGKRVQTGLQQFSSRGLGMQLGRMWTALIVLQVAAAVAALPAAMKYAGESLRAGTEEPPAMASAMLRGTLWIANQSDEQTTDAGPAVSERQRVERFPERTAALAQRLERDPQVAAVTVPQRFPGSEMFIDVEAEQDSAAKDGSGPQSMRIAARMNRVALNLFDVFEVPLLAGRRFVAADASPGATAVIVDRTFVDRIGGGNVIGRRVRYLQGRGGQSETGPWLEIVGVVPAFAETFNAQRGAFSSPPAPRLYQAGTPGDTHPATLVVRLRSGPAARFAPRLRDVAAAVDPNLRIERLMSVTDNWDQERFAFRLMAMAIIAVTMSVLRLSTAGIYAMMSFTVAKRRREIGIRAALGADPRHVLMGIFGRAGAQLGAGVALGLAVAAAIEWIGGGDLMAGKGLVLLPTVVAMMFTVGLLAALGPARRGLAVQPTEVLRDE